MKAQPLSFLCLLLTLLAAVPVVAQVPPEDKAQALLQEVMTREKDRQQAAKIKEVERLNEDMEKDRKEAEDLKATLPALSAAVTDSANRLAQLTARKKQLSKMLEIATLQIDAEDLKVDGLKMLKDAQEKSLVSLGKKIEQTQAKIEIQKAKMNPPPAAGSPESGRSALEQEKLLERNERAASTARTAAREAMSAATAKLDASKIADTKAHTRAAELSIPIFGEPAPAQENVEPLKDVDPAQTDNIPIALPNQ